MKKIIALILAMIMVVFAVAACGDASTTDPTNAPTAAPTTAPTQGTTQATTTEAPVVIPDPYTAICMYTLGAEPVGVNITTGDVVGALTAAEGVDLVAGNLYVVDVVPAEGKATATKVLGAAVSLKNSTGGWTNANAEGKLILKDNSYLMRAVSNKNFKWNAFMDTALLNTTLADESMGKFGTMKFKYIDGDLTTFTFDGSDEENTIVDYKWNFVYVSYDGSSLAPATGKEYVGSILNARDIMYTAIDKAYGNEIGTFRATWVTTMQKYGGLASVVTQDGKYNGTTEQNYWTAKWQNELIPVKYDSALSQYNALKAEGAETVDEAAYEAALAAANKALADAQKALADAVAAKTDVKALYDAMVAAEAAYTATRQPEYEARAAHETEKAKNKDSQATADALVVRNEKKAIMDAAKAEYDAAKAAYDAAIEADAELKALNAVLLDVKDAEGKVVTKGLVTLQKDAQSNVTKIENYKTYADLYAKFIEAYNDIANVALWDVEDMDNSAVVKMYGNAEEGDKEKAALPSFTYYYDAATDTYTIFVTSAKTDIMVEKFSTGNQPLTGKPATT